MATSKPAQSLSKASARSGAFLSLYAPTAENLDFLADVLRNGGLVALPSETVYGLAADATNPEACRAIFALKKRPYFDPLIVHVADLAQATEYAVFNPVAQQLAAAFWPGPLTIVLPRTSLVPDEVTSGLPTVALRSPAHPLFREILFRVKRGLAAPSANPFGYISPTDAHHVEDSFGSRLSYILNGGPCSIGVESTIVDASDPAQLTILREGGISKAELESLVAAHQLATTVVARDANDQPKAGQPAIAPGLLKRHYSPRKSLKLYPNGALPDPDQYPRVAFVFHQQPTNAGANVFALSEDGSGIEAARRLYATLRALDTGDWTDIFAELPPLGCALGEALADRLGRAAAQD